MNTSISPIDMKKLIKASKNSVIRTAVADAVSKNFRSLHLLASELICDAVVLNLILNDTVTPSSANEIIVCIKREYKSFYTTVDSAYKAVEAKFAEYAKSVLGDGYETAAAESIRNVNFIVYVISTDLSRKNLSRDEVYIKAYTREEIIDGKIPHY